jgi:hypothetical protein
MELTGIAGQMNNMAQHLSKDQKDTLEEILSRYDPENLSRNDLQSLREEIADAGIPRNSAAMRVLREAGFNLRGQGQGPEKDVEDFLEVHKGELWGLFKQFQMGKLSEAEFKTAVGELKAGMLLNISF